MPEIKKIVILGILGQLGSSYSLKLSMFVNVTKPIIMKKILLIALLGSLFAATSAYAGCGSCDANAEKACKAECKKECCAEKAECAEECTKPCCAKEEADETAAAATKCGACPSKSA